MKFFTRNVSNLLLLKIIKKKIYNLTKLNSIGFHETCCLLFLNVKFKKLRSRLNLIQSLVIDVQ